MSEGKKTLVVVEDLDRLLLRGQLDGMGLDIEVVVDNNQTGVMGSMIMGLLSNPATKEEALTVLAKRDYSGDYRADASLLLEKVAKEFNEFCVFHKFQALRDSTIGKLNYAFSQGPDSGGNPALQDEQLPAFASIKGLEQVIPNLMMEMLKELKGIKEAVIPTTVKIDMGSDKALVDFLSTPRLSMAEIIDGLKTYFTAPRTEEAEKSAFCIHDWLNFAMKNQDEIKAHVAKFGPVTYEGKPVTSKAGAIEELTNILKWESGGLNLLPSVLLFSLPAKDREEIIRLLHPKQTFVFGEELEGASPASADVIIETLLSALREEVPSDVHLCGLSALRAQERVILIDKLEQGTDKYTSKVAGGSKRTLLEGLVNALQGDIRFTSRIVIRGLGVLTPEDVTALTNLFKVGLQDTTEFVDSQSPDEHVLDKLTEIFGGDDTNSIVLHNLKGMPGEDKRYIYTSLLTAVKKYQELKRIKKEFLVNGDRAFKGDNKPANLTFTLSELGQKWVREAAGYGIAIDPLILISHLFGQMGLHGGIETGAKIFRTEPTTMTLTNVAGASIKLGNHTFERNEDGSLKILTDVNGKSNTVILNTDGGVMLHGPGYMG